MSALYSHTTRSTGTVLTAAIYNADHQNHITNGIASQLGGYSANTSEMQTTFDPGEVGTENLPGSIAEEIAALRHMIAEITGETEWYESPSANIANITGVGDLLTGYISGLTLSNDGTDITNDLDIAVGVAASESAVKGLMILSSALVKKLDAAWAVGTNQGGLDTGSIANTTYHVHLIKRPDTGVVDILFSESATSPTMPANYTMRRRIGSLQRVSGAWQVFKQFGDEFRLNISVTDVNLTGLSAATANRTLTSLPAGLEVQAVLHVGIGDAGANGHLLYVDYPGENDALNGIIVKSQAGETVFTGTVLVRVDTSKRVQTTLTGSGSGGIIVLTTRGWVDTRGKG